MPGSLFEGMVKLTELFAGTALTFAMTLPDVLPGVELLPVVDGALCALSARGRRMDWRLRANQVRTSIPTPPLMAPNMKLRRLSCAARLAANFPRGCACLGSHRPLCCSPVEASCTPMRTDRGCASAARCCGESDWSRRGTR